VDGDEKGTQYPGLYLGHRVPGGYNYGDLALQVGGVSNEKGVAMSSEGLGPESDSELC
jgi:hypothetical protein